VLSACLPPFRTFISGTGSTVAFAPPTYRYSGNPAALAAAWAAARDTPRMAFAPNFALFGVPSSSSIFLSRATWSNTSMPASALASGPLTFSTAFVVPLPR
jgi:hypothetical protein